MHDETAMMLVSAEKWLGIAVAAAVVLRFAAVAAVVRGVRFPMAVGVLAGGACGAAVSALCTVFAVHALGSFGIIVAIPLAAIIAYWFTEKPRRERQEWLRLEMKYFDVMTAMGLIVGVLATGLVLRHFHLLITPKWAINWP